MKNSLNDFIVPVLLVAIALTVIGWSVYIYKNRTEMPFVSNTSKELLIVQDRGGLCQYGGCFSTIIISKDGTFATEDGSGSKKSGNLGASEVKNLQNLIENSNYKTLRKTPFTDICPTAYDGSEFTYKFQTSHGDEIIGSCTTKIDSSNPLFQEVQKILNSIYSYN
ncbi:MAG: hypothetical protein ABI430_00410 [Candidatus Taylorbacteria bacterium]